MVNLSYWISNVTQCANSSTQVVLVGNKADLIDERLDTTETPCRVDHIPHIDSTHAIQTDPSNRLSSYPNADLEDQIRQQYKVSIFHTSAKSGFNVSQAFEYIISKAYLKQLELHNAPKATPETVSPLFYDCDL